MGLIGKERLDICLCVCVCGRGGGGGGLVQVSFEIIERGCCTQKKRGRLFQMERPTTEKAPAPTVDSLKRGIGKPRMSRRYWFPARPFVQLAGAAKAF